MNWTDLHAYVDNQLTPEERASVKETVASSPEAQAEVAAVLNLKQLIADRAEKHTCEVTWKRCQSRLNEMDKARRTEYFVGRYAWAICGAFLGMILIGGQMNRNAGGLGTSDVARYASLLDTRPTNSSTDSPALKRFRDTVLSPSGQGVDFSQPQFRAGYEFVDNGRLVQVLKLADANGMLTLFRVPGQKIGEGLDAIPGTRFHAGMVGKVNCVAWEQGGALLLMAGPRTYDELKAAAERYCCEKKPL